MQRNYEKVFRDLGATGGQRSLWELLWPREGQLTKLILKQVGGVNVDFTLKIYSALVAGSHSQSSGGADPEGEYSADPNNYLVTEPLSSDSPGTLVKFFSGGDGHFINQDPGGPTNRKKRLYIEIVPGGSGVTTWDLTLAAVLHSAG